MPIKLIVPGQREAAPPAAAERGAGPAAGKPATDLLEGVEELAAFSLAPAARARGVAEPVSIEAQEDDILQIEFEGGFTLWTSVARYREQLADLKPGSVTADSVTVDVLPRPSATERGGVREWSGTGLRLLRLGRDRILEELKDPKQWPDWAKDLARGKAEELGAWAATKLLTWFIENRLKPGPGLYRWSDAPGGAAGELLSASGGIPADRPILVFLHGTASRTASSFGAFTGTEAKPQWRELRKFFGEHIYAFEHRSLSESPIDNATALAKLLPAGAKIHLVSHSRGGLVGDLLCLDGIDAGQIKRFRRGAEDLAQADEHDRKGLRELGGVLKAKRLQVARFARVACPARGTLLASENIDQFLSILTNLIGLIPGFMGSPLYEVAKRVTLEVVRNRLKPELLPGIEAMVPSSPLVDLLNTAARPASGELGVIAGDIEGGGWLKQLGTFLSDTLIYDDRDNDLVVNTDSMFQGAPRPKKLRPSYVFDQGADVSHFNYFRNERTRNALLGWLTHKPGHPPGEFSELEQAQETEPVPMLRSIKKRSGQPLVFVLHGIMGSHLARNGERIWLSYLKLLGGGLADLASAGDGAVKPTHLIGDYYGALCAYLADSHEVIPFAYDWRRSITGAAKELAAQVEKALDDARPVRFVAHSMGGLVVRRMMADRPDLWNKICKHEGRLVMLGTPNRGSHAMVETLLGTAATVKQLALLDLKHDRQAVLDIVSGFAGALELLPRGDGLDFFARGTWERFKKVSGVSALPSAATLASARRAVDDLPEAIPHPERVLYVAGSAPATVCRAEVSGDGKRVVLHATTEGDGRVTYASGKLRDVLTWFADAEHGELADCRPAFPAIADLLERGTTSRLPDMPPTPARGAPAEFRYFPEPVLYPTEADLTAGLLGRRPPRRQRQPSGKLIVEVIHGDLREAGFPVMVGHYAGDTIAGAERELDRRLGNALTERYHLGLYPGVQGSVAAVLREPSELQEELGVPRGAIVIGLGRWGDLAPNTLANAVRDGVLHYVLELLERKRGDDAEAGTTGLSMLLIGYNSSANMAVEDSVSALLRGVIQANLELKRSARTCPCIGRLEIVEIFSDTAVQAARAVNELAEAIRRDLGVSVEAVPILRQCRSGLRRLTQNPGRDYWRRWEISVVGEPEPVALSLPRPLAKLLEQVLSDPSGVNAESWKAVVDLALAERAPARAAHRSLRFLALSDRARAEVTFQQRQPELIEELIRTSVTNTSFRPEEAAILFELVIPNDLKDSLAQQSNVALVLDAETANYPWELMVDNREPLCVKIGLVRQLQTARFRQQIRAATANAALVIGNPLTPEAYPSLQGAQDEAYLVASRLARRFTVEHSDQRLGAREVFASLFARPYRVLHLAGHGDYRAADAGGEVKTGMVLEGGVFLTAVEIAKMRQVPDLVFLNCCHLAKMDAGPVAYNKLAASVSQELIEMGVRAVVAAGWAVADNAAHRFATAFYDSMLGGETFGRALLRARAETWRSFPECNTWGAYQAYGDPDFRIAPAQEQAAAARQDRQEKRLFVAPEELFMELDWIRVSREGTDPTEADQARVFAKIRKLYESCPAEWRGRADVLEKFGKVYGELGNFAEAVKFLSGALAADQADSPLALGTVEQLANYEARLGENEKDPDRVRAAIGRLQNLLAIAETSERLSLLGSAHKRLAQIEPGREAARAELAQSAECYRRAADRDARTGKFDIYPLYNSLACEVLMGGAVAELGARLDECAELVKANTAASRSVWNAFAFPDLQLLKGMLKGSLPLAVDDIAKKYRDAVRDAKASARQIDSVANQIEFLAGMIEKLGRGDPAGSGTAAALKQILEKLKPGTARLEAAPAGAPAPAKRARQAPSGRKPVRKRSRKGP